MKDKKGPSSPPPPPSSPPAQAPQTDHAGDGGGSLLADSSLVSGISGSSSAASINSNAAGRSDSLQQLVGATGHHHHHHHHHNHPTMAGMQQHFRRDRRKGAKVLAPNVLTITMDDSNNLEDKIQAHGNYIRQRITLERNDSALNIIANQINDLGELEWMLDNEAKLLLRRHAILWKSALSMTKHKIPIKETVIPLTATQAYYHPLTKVQRYCRTCGTFCCPLAEESMNQDLMRHGSLRAFQEKINSEAELYKTTSASDVNNTKTQVRREKTFDKNAPAGRSSFFGPNLFHNLISSGKGNISNESIGSTKSRNNSL
jgi:hypothetical protein